jgi:hypothetical protein
VFKVGFSQREDVGSRHTARYGLELEIRSITAAAKTYSKSTLTNTSMPIKAAAIAKPLSSPPVDATGTYGRGGGAGRPAGAAAGRGAGVGGAGAGAGAAATGGAWTGALAGGAAAAGVGAGILMVGAAVGLGGKLMRTVSFLGCTLAASVGLGGTAPNGGFGICSAINVFAAKLEFGPGSVNGLFV